MSYTGKCLCQAVQVIAEKPNLKLGACHCNMCRKWTGGPFFAVDCGASVVFDGEEHIAVFDSSQWAERGFCQICGTHLFYRLKQQQQYMLSAGLFEAIKNFEFDHQVFIDEKPDYYTFSNQTHDMTGAEIFAKYEA